MITLYQAEWCPYCHRVRQTLSELGLSYMAAAVPAEKQQRTELIELSGQDEIPVLVDGEHTIAGSSAIEEYLRETYPPAPDAEKHAQSGFFRYVLESDESPQDLLARVKALLAKHRFDVAAEVGITPKEGDGIGTYVLLQAVVPVALAVDLAADPSVPSALTIPISVYPIEDGSQVAITDPFVGVWLFGEAPLLDMAKKLRRRIKQLFEEL
jgi:glutaredoxin